MFQSIVSFFRIKNFFSRIWSLLPKEDDFGLLNGVKVGWEQRRYGDQLFPFGTPSFNPNFKGANIDQIRRNVGAGDAVIVIGGGRGITSVVAARMAGQNGKVDIYEPDENRIPTIYNTLSLNNVQAVCTVHHAAIGPVYRVGRNVVEHAEFKQSSITGTHFRDTEYRKVSPCDLPKCDVLEMDCEGAELSILENLKIRPKCIIVEAHHNKIFSPYSCPEALASVLVNNGYTVSRHGGTPDSPKIILGLKNGEE